MRVSSSGHIVDFFYLYSFAAIRYDAMQFNAFRWEYLSKQRLYDFNVMKSVVTIINYL